MEHSTSIVRHLLDEQSPVNVDGLIDTLLAIVHDCNFPVLRRSKQIDNFLNKYEHASKQLAQARVNHSDFELIKVIGRGAFGEVQLVRHSQTRKVYALKCLDKNEMLRRADSAFFWEERHIMAHCKSDWIVRLHYAFQDAKHLYMAMEFMPGGDLVSLMQNFEISEKWARFYLAEVCLALNAIHEMGYIHRDVKPDNMLISATGHIKLADFGTCVRMRPDGTVRSSTAVGTPDYISPEILSSNGNETEYGREVDFWSVGVFFYELLIGETPFYADALVQTYARILNYKTELKFPPDVFVTDKAKDLIRKFLTDSQSRLGKNSIEEIKAHPFFQNDEWTFETIRTTMAPHIPVLKSDIDTSNFDDVEEKTGNPADNFQSTKLFTGNQLPFVGFTYSNDLGPIRKLKVSDNPNENTSNGFPDQDTMNYIDSLKENISQLETDRQSLEKQLTEAKCEVKEQQRKLDLEKEVVAQKEGELRRLEKQLQNASTMDDTIRDLQSKLNDEVKRNNEITEEEGKLKKHISELKSEIQTHSGTIEKLNEKLSNSRDKESSIQGELIEVKKEIAVEKENSRRYQNKIYDLEVQFAQTKNELQETVTREIALIKQLSDLKKDKVLSVKNDNDNNDIERLKGDLDAAKRNVDILKKDILYEQERKRKAENELSDIANELARKSADEEYNKLEFEKIRIEKDRLETNISLLSNEKKSLEYRVNELMDQLEMEQQFVTAFKNEIHTARHDLSDKQRKLEFFSGLEVEFNNVKSQLEVEQLNRRIAEEQLAQLEKEKTMVNLELRQTMQRFDKERESKEKIMNLMSQKENDYSMEIQKLKDEMTKLQNSNNHRRQGSTGSGYDSYGRSDSRLLNLSKAGEDLESLTKEQLINKLKKETLMKEATIKKLEEISKSHPSILPPTGKKDKKNYPKNNALEMENIRLRERLEFLQFEHSKEIELLKSDLCSEQVHANELRIELEQCKGVLEELHRTREMDDQSVASHDSGGGLQVEYPFFSIHEINFTSFVSIRGRFIGKRRVNWVKLRAQLTSEYLQFFHIDKSKTPTVPALSLDITNICHLRRCCTSADVKDDEVKYLPMIFQIFFYAVEDKKAAKSKDASLYKNHEFVELAFKTNIPCDKCTRSLHGLPKGEFAIQCKKCMAKYHSHHRTQNEIPPCKVSSNAEQLLVLSESSKAADEFTHVLNKIIQYYKNESKDSNSSHGRLSGIIKFNNSRNNGINGSRSFSRVSHNETTTSFGSTHSFPSHPDHYCN